MKTQITSFDLHTHCDEAVPSCPYCDMLLDTGIIRDGMHDKCHRQFGKDLKEVFPDPINILIEPSEMVLPISDYLDWLGDIDSQDSLVWD